jgi:hypothetical protein
MISLRNPDGSLPSEGPPFSMANDNTGVSSVWRNRFVLYERWGTVGWSLLSLGSCGVSTNPDYAPFKARPGQVRAYSVTL